MIQLVNYSASGGGGGGADTALSNLASVSINTSLLAQAGVDLGSSSAPFRSGFLSATSVDAVGAKLNLYKSRSGGVITTGDVLGDIDFYGHDGSNQLLMGRIRSVSTGTIASTRVPTALEFYTATNAAPSVLTKALTLGADQSATFAKDIVLSTNAAGVGLTVNGTSGQVFAFSSGGVNGAALISSNNSSTNGFVIDVLGSTQILRLQTASTDRLVFTTSSATLSLPLISSGSANTAYWTGTGYSITGSGTTSMIDLAGTLNTSGVTDVVKIATTVTAAGTGSKLLNLYGGASGTTSVFSVGTDGTATLGGTTLDGILTTSKDLYLQTTGNKWLILKANGVTGLVIKPASVVTTLPIDISGIAAGSPNLVITATSDTPGTTWDVVGTNNPSAAPSGYLEISVGGSTRYIPFYA